MVAGKEADEKWASSQHVYIAYMIVENKRLSPGADCKKVIHLSFFQFQ